ncbi:hypothetical protein K439DRAFT_1633749 [Ramaria rubella]|nr:hypothetical protein K439DRAFT_1633749 [Ramaria rubella]
MRSLVSYSKLCVSPPFLHLAPGLDLRHSSHSSFAHPGRPSGSTSSIHNDHNLSRS